MIRKEQLRLYAITDTSWLNGASLIDVVENVLKNGATFLQLREKNASHEEIVAKAKAIKPITRKYGIPFVIDDDVQAALEADADGVHIGQSDTDYMTARSILGDNKIIGMTAKTVEQAKDIVDWIRSYGGRLVDVARIAGCAHSTISLIKSGTRHSFTLDMYSKMNTARTSLENITNRDEEQSQ